MPEEAMNMNQMELASSLGDEALMKRMDHEERADALEDHMSKQLDAAVAARRPLPIHGSPTLFGLVIVAGCLVVAPTQAFLYAFDLLEQNGKGWRPLEERKEKLKKLLAKTPAGIQYSEHLEADGAAIFAHAQVGMRGHRFETPRASVSIGAEQGLSGDQESGGTRDNAV
jgi:hypothetical protein